MWRFQEAFRIQLNPEEFASFFSYHCLLISFVPPVVSQEEVKRSSSGSPEVLGKVVKLLEGVLVPMTKE